MEIAPGVRTLRKHPAVSPEGHPLPCPAINPAFPNERPKFKTDAPKCPLEEVSFHLIIAASEGEVLRQP